MCIDVATSVVIAGVLAAMRCAYAAYYPKAQESTDEPAGVPGTNQDGSIEESEGQLNEQAEPSSQTPSSSVTVSATGVVTHHNKSTASDPAMQFERSARTVTRMNDSVRLPSQGQDTEERKSADPGTLLDNLVLYVEPGAQHEEKPGMWAAIRAFLDYHLLGVRRNDAYLAPLARNVWRLDGPEEDDAVVAVSNDTS